MNRCAVAIGVNKTGDLPMLKAAASSAISFAQWAESQGIQVSLLTDDKGREVFLRDIKNAVRCYVQQQTFDQLIVFFSGHGILKAPDYELWLLSGAPEDPDEAVNIPGSILLSRNVLIPHIVFISDACRSLSNSARLSQLNGGLIFPNNLPVQARPAVDVFYASLPGNPALEVPSEYASDNYSGIFTECLLKGLHGNVPEVIVNIGDQGLNHPRFVVPSWALKSYLEHEVPTVAASIHIKYQQEPDIRVESHPPKFLAEVSPFPEGMRLSAQKEPADKFFQHAFDDLPDEVTENDDDFHTPLQGGLYYDGPCNFDDQSENALAVIRLLNVKGRESFETRTGFTVIGSQVERAIITASSFDIFEENDACQIRVHNDGNQHLAQTALLQLQGGVGVPLAVLPGFIGTVVVEEGRIVTVNYIPSRNTPKFSEYQNAADKIEQRKAFVAVAARNGLFRIEGHNAAILAANFLRVLKSIDPTLGLYSAYAFAHAGDIERVTSVYQFMSQEPEPVLFDVAMLAGKILNSTSQAGHPNSLSPFCPMLSQGWAFIEPNEILLPEAVMRSRGNLLPGLWTTFNSEGVAILWSAIEEGDFT